MKLVVSLENFPKTHLKQDQAQAIYVETLAVRLSRQLVQEIKVPIQVSSNRVLDTTDISSTPSGREASNPRTNGDDVSGMLADIAVACLAEAEEAERKNKMFELQRDL